VAEQKRLVLAVGQWQFCDKVVAENEEVLEKCETFHIGEPLTTILS
jgi:hypothetical protein